MCEVKDIHVHRVLTSAGRWTSMGTYVGQYPMVRMFTVSSMLPGMFWYLQGGLDRYDGRVNQQFVPIFMTFYPKQLTFVQKYICQKKETIYIFTYIQWLPRNCAIGCVDNSTCQRNNVEPTRAMVLGNRSSK